MITASDVRIDCWRDSERPPHWFRIVHVPTGAVIEGRFSSAHEALGELENCLGSAQQSLTGSGPARNDLS